MIRKNVLLVLAGGALAVLGASPRAVHGESVRSIVVDPAAVRPTLISGFDASQQTPKEPGNSAILSGLEMDETGDKPCFLRAHWWRFTTDGLPQELTTDFDICSKPVDGDKSALFENARDSKTGVRAIQVCNNGDNNHRLKGVKLFGAFVDRNNSGTVTSTGTTRFFERTNCKHPWKAVRECGSGEVAVGLLVEHTDDEITGLGLRCAKPSITVVTDPDDAASRFTDMENDIRVQVDKDGATRTLSLNEAIALHEVAGATVVIIFQGKVALVRHYGMRNAKENLKTNGDTLYQAASLSKLFGGLAMAKASRLSHGPRLDDTVQQTADAHPNSLIADWVDKKFGRDEKDYPSEITVRRLMGHSAGLTNSGIGNSKSDNATELETILLGDPFTDSTKPRSRPGTEYCYSGGGVSAAEAMLQIHSGRTPREFLNKEILEAYGLTKSTFNDASDSMSNLARGCSRGICSTKPKHTEAKFAGGLLANPEEYARLVTYLMSYGQDETGKQIIPLDDVEAVLTPTYHRSSSLQDCSRKNSTCPSGETCAARLCKKPLKDCDDGDTTWYGLGVGLGDQTPFGKGGYSQILSHSGGNPDGDSATLFKADRATGRGIVVMVNGEYEWKKNGAVFGSSPLVDDIVAAFDRHF
jgi:CubicO group peptidase (beta-lactamase class C family)